MHVFAIKRSTGYRFQGTNYRKKMDINKAYLFLYVERYVWNDDIRRPESFEESDKCARHTYNGIND